MSNIESLKQIYEGILSINELLKNKITSYSDMSINMNENLESLQYSSIEIKKYIDVLKSDIENEENIFFVGLGSQKNQQKLEEQEKLKEDLENNIRSLQDSIKSEKEKIKFLESISSKLFDYNNMINNIIIKNEENKGKEEVNNSDIKTVSFEKSDLLVKLKRCQRFSKVDYERCYIELGKIIEEVEVWE